MKNTLYILIGLIIFSPFLTQASDLASKPNNESSKAKPAFPTSCKQLVTEAQIQTAFAYKNTVSISEKYSPPANAYQNPSLECNWTTLSATNPGAKIGGSITLTANNNDSAAQNSVKSWCQFWIPGGHNGVNTTNVTGHPLGDGPSCLYSAQKGSSAHATFTKGNVKVGIIGNANAGADGVSATLNLAQIVLGKL